VRPLFIFLLVLGVQLLGLATRHSSSACMGHEWSLAALQWTPTR
jgi:hypothetical protein